jgi:excisionase family DNA binding protein
MQKTILSTADVARLFNVTETTVKRWADDGSLKCQRTPGGHRKFVIKYVIDFAEKNKMEPLGVLEMPEEDGGSQGLKIAVLERDMDTLAMEFCSRATAPGRGDLRHFFSYLYEHKIPLCQIFDDILQPGMRMIGDRWERGELTIDHEHRASYATADVIAQLQEEISAKPTRGRLALLSCVGDEQHEMGLRCAATIFMAEGWDTNFLGARVPLEAIVGAILEARPQAVCISVSGVCDAEELGPMLNVIIDAAHEVSAVAVLGGRAARERGYHQKSFDLVATSMRELSDTLERWESSQLERSF